MKTPAIEAVKKYCKHDCMNDQRGEVEKCPSTDCPLYRFRLGEKMEHVNTLKYIHKRCEGCSENPEKCDFTNCSLYPFKKLP